MEGLSNSLVLQAGLGWDSFFGSSMSCLRVFPGEVHTGKLCSTVLLNILHRDLDQEHLLVRITFYSITQHTQAHRHTGRHMHVCTQTDTHMHAQRHTDTCAHTDTRHTYAHTEVLYFHNDWESLN